MNINAIGVADNKIAEVSFSPRFDAKGQLPADRCSQIQAAQLRAVLEYEYRKTMLPDLKQQVCPGAVLEVCDASAKKPERSVMQVWQVERKRQLALEPRFHRVLVGRYNVYGVGAGQRRSMQVRELAQDLITTRTL